MPNPPKSSDLEETVTMEHGVRVVMPDEPHRPVLASPQFRLKQIFAFMALFAIGMVGMRIIDPMVCAGLILLGLCVLAHVAGNAVGMKLRGTESLPPADASAPLHSSHYAPTTRLSLHHRLGRLTLVFTLLGALLGGAGGGSLLAIANWEFATLANVTLAALSCSVLGGLFGFWLSSFLQVFLQAWKEAHQNADH